METDKQTFDAALKRLLQAEPKPKKAIEQKRPRKRQKDQKPQGER